MALFSNSDHQRQCLKWWFMENVVSPLCPKLWVGFWIQEVTKKEKGVGR